MNILKLLKIFLTWCCHQFKCRLQPRNQRMLRLRGPVMEELGKIIKNTDVSLDTKPKMIHTLLFPITMYVCKCWTVKKTDRRKKQKKIGSLEIWCWRRSLRIPQITKRQTGRS